MRRCRRYRTLPELPSRAADLQCREDEVGWGSSWFAQPAERCGIDPQKPRGRNISREQNGHPSISRAQLYGGRREEMQPAVGAKYPPYINDLAMVTLRSRPCRRWPSTETVAAIGCRCL